MKNQENLLFIAKCLTLDQYPKRIVSVRKRIQSGEINWEEIVWVSSSQFVLPAFYLQLKRNGLTEELALDLIRHFEEITQLNRARNRAILAQVEDIVIRLQKNEIFPVFLKGVAHLLKGLYIDPAERMIGDIDFLVPAKQMVKTAEILIHEGYTPLVQYDKKSFSRIKHYPRLHNNQYSAAVEIHKEVLYFPKHKVFKGSDIIKDKVEVCLGDNRVNIPSDRHLIIHNTYHNQVNNKAFMYGDICLRSMYDLQLLAYEEDVRVIANSNKKTFHLFNNYFALTAYMFSNPENVKYTQTIKSEFYIWRLHLYHKFPLINRINRIIVFLVKQIKTYISTFIRSIFNKNVRVLLIDRLKNPAWYKSHFQSYIDLFK